MKIRVLLPLVTLAIIFTSSSLSRAQWVPTTGLPGGSIPCLAVSGPNLFAATCCDGRDAALYRSTNGGVSWSLASSPPAGYGINAMAGNGAVLFASNGSGLFRTTDQGPSWTQSNLAEAARG